jgi:hypothetical protein
VGQLSSRFSADAIRLPRAVVLQLAKSCPEALSALCRVCWFARGRGAAWGTCFAGRAALQALGVLMSLAVLRRGLLSLLAQGLLHQRICPERRALVYAPQFPKKAQDAVFFCPEAWRGLKPTELAMLGVSQALGAWRGAAELGAHVAGRGGKPLSRSQAYAVFRTLQQRGLLPSDGCPENDRGVVRKTHFGASEKTLPKADVLKSDRSKSGDPPVLLISKTQPQARAVSAEKTAKEYSEAQTQTQLPLRLFRVIREENVVIDYLAVCGLEDEAKSSLVPLRVAAPMGVSAPAPDRQPAPLPTPGGWHTLVQAWRQAQELAPKLRTSRRYAGRGTDIDLGLPGPLYHRFIAGWTEASSADPAWTPSDVVRLGEYVAAGGLDWCGDALAYCCGHLCAVLERAAAWHAEGRPDLRKKGQHEPAPWVYQGPAPEHDDTDELFRWQAAERTKRLAGAAT